MATSRLDLRWPNLNRIKKTKVPVWSEGLPGASLGGHCQLAYRPGSIDGSTTGTFSSCTLMARCRFGNDRIDRGDVAMLAPVSDVPSAD